jgi:hypothetical protein
MAISGAAAETGAGAFISNVTPTTILTNAQGAGKIVKFAKLLICNIDEASAHYFSMFKVPSGGSISGTDYAVVWKKDIPASSPGNIGTGTEDSREAAGLHMENGDSLRLLAETASKLKFDSSHWLES